GQLGAHGDVLGGLGRDLLSENAVQEVGERELLGGGVLEQRLQPLATLEQAQAGEVLVPALELRGLHWGAWASASERARSRTSTSGHGAAPWRPRLPGVKARWRAVRAMAPGPCSGTIRT